MKRWVIAAIVVGVLLVAALPAIAVTLARHVGDDRGASHGHGAMMHRAMKDTGLRHAMKQRLKHRGDHGFGQGLGMGRGPGSAWQNLTPAQRARKMAQLATQHADAMQKWAACLAAAKTDAAGAACVRPLPPGLAKRQ